MADGDPREARSADARPPDAGVSVEATGSSQAHAPGWREVLLVGAVVVAIVLGLAVATSLLPVSFQDVVFRSPLAIVVLLVGTVGVLLWVARRPTPRV